MHWLRFALALWFLLLFTGGGCGPSPGAPIIVFCSPDSPRMRQAIAGLEATLGQGPLEVVCVPEFGDQGRETLGRVRHKRPRLLVVLGTPALMLVAPVEKETPVVFALVANPYFTGGAYDPRHPEIHQENITGVASPAPITAALQHGAALLGPSSWGLLYDPNDGVAVEAATRFTQEAPALGITTLIATSTDAATDRRGLEALLAQGARVLYLPPAPSAGRYAETVLAWGKEHKVLVVSSLAAESHPGAVLWVTLDYRRLGEEAGVLARRVLKGESPKLIPIVDSVPLRVQVDEALLRRWSSYPPPVRKLKE